MDCQYNYQYKRLSQTQEPVIIDLYGVCRTIICCKGKLEIEILTKRYVLEDRDMIICLPYINATIRSVICDSLIIIGTANIENVLSVVNQSINSKNILTIRKYPVVNVDKDQFYYLNASIKAYIDSSDEQKNLCETYDEICHQIRKTLISLRGQSIILQILESYFSKQSSDCKSFTRHDIIFQSFMLLLYTDYKKSREVKYYADASGVSLKYFSTIIKGISGRTPSQWIDIITCYEAKNLLQKEGYSVKEVAMEMNFPDSSTFTKYFYRCTGLSPKSYKLQSVNKL